MNITKCKECGCTKMAEDRVADLERQLAKAQGKLEAVRRAVDAASDSGQYSLALVEIAAILDLDRILSKEGNDG